MTDERHTVPEASPVPPTPRRPGSAGFTLIELLIVVAIIGIVSAMAVVNLTGALQKARQRKTMSGMRTVSSAIENYGSDLGYLPSNGLTAAQLKAVLSNQIYKSVDTLDGWNNDLSYVVSAGHYTLQSYGKDNAIGPANSSYATRSNYEYDIILNDGIFIASPER